MKDETIWLSQKGMVELFECSTDNVGLHLKNIFATGELQENRTAEEFSVVQNEGKRTVTRRVTFYNLDAIISVGYRVNSARASQFRISFIMRLPGRLRRKLFMKKLTTKKKIWGLQPGKILLMAES